MNRLLRPFVLAISLLNGSSYAYCAWRLADSWWHAALLAVPFLLVWMVPVVYWGSDREQHGKLDEWMHRAGYLSMALVSFLLVMTLARDGVLITFDRDAGVAAVYGGAVLILFIGMLVARRGPSVAHVEVHVAGLAPDLEGFRIVQISDLHIGLNIGRSYVEHVVEKTLALQPDLVALTGDIVDASIARIAGDVAPLATLAETGRSYFILGNHDVYSGAGPWTAHFKAMGMRVLENTHDVIRKGNATMVVGGVLDPAIRMIDRSLAPRADLAAEGSPRGDFRLLLAHNPSLASQGASAGWDLMLSGHTHAGQFFPWTLVIHFFHQHVFGLSREGRMQVYVSAGTGTWGPPVRMGTRPELTLLRLVRASARG